MHGPLVPFAARRRLIELAQDRALVGEQEGLAEPLAPGHEMLVGAFEELADHGVLERQVLEGADVDLVAIRGPALAAREVLRRRRRLGGAVADRPEAFEQLARRGEAALAIAVDSPGKPRIEAAR